MWWQQDEQADAEDFLRWLGTHYPEDLFEFTWWNLEGEEAPAEAELAAPEDSTDHPDEAAGPLGTATVAEAEPGQSEGAPEAPAAVAKAKAGTGASCFCSRSC